MALTRIGVRPGDALAIDDSPNGVRSAHTVGLRVIGLAGAFDEAALRAAGADGVVAGLAELTEGIDVLRRE